MKAYGASQYNAGWHEALDLEPLLTVSEAVTRAALLREESRGGHTRAEFELESDEWAKVNVVVSAGPGGMQVRKEVRPEPPAELKAIALATLEELEGTHGGKA